MIEIIVGAAIYTVTLIGCPTGDMCHIKYNGINEYIKFSDFRTPSLMSVCSQERVMASTSAMVTSAYMRQVGKVYSDGERDVQGRILVTAPELKEHFIEYNYARELDDEKGWC